MDDIAEAGHPYGIQYYEVGISPGELAEVERVSEDEFSPAETDADTGYEALEYDRPLP